ncbi:hypothetical protein MLD38_024066 [Melastoma candidum]|uniref:Uncharacterized protein n=1 Tax=Melastoma candidum TaxID=119954 RepID=A0ACB9NSV4_9MYRT|nr:hypothetical protein MLD38_024066 [Melastoma candidum]
MDDKSLRDVVSELRASIHGLISLSRDCDAEGGALNEFAFLLEKFGPVAHELPVLSEGEDESSLKKAIKSLVKEFSRAENLMKQANSGCSARKIEDLARDLGRSLGLVLFAGVGFSTEAKRKIGDLYRELMTTSFRNSQVTSLRTSTSSGSGYRSESETEEMVDEREIVEEEMVVLDIDDVAFLLKHGEEEELRHALLVLWDLIRRGHTTHEWIENQGIVSVLCNRLSSDKGNNRLIILRIIGALASDENAIIKDKLAEAASLSAIVGSLTEDVEESQEAVGILLSLSDLPAARRRLGKIQGCIVTLVAILHREDSVAASNAIKLLNALSSNTQNALHMAEAGYFKPLVHYLKEGSEMSKILMASAVYRMELTDQHKSVLGEDGAVDPLANMLSAGKLEAKLCSLSALQKLISLTENVPRLVNTGIVGYLLQLLFSVTSVLMTLREPVSAILARIAECESVLVNPRVAQQMLSLLNLCSPKIQNHLLQALNSISTHPSASRVRRKMKENGVIQLILPFITENNSKIRISALKLLHNLSKDSGNELGEHFGEYYLQNLLDIISYSANESERATAVGILGNLPLTDNKVTEIMRKSNLLPALLSELASASETTISADCGGGSFAEGTACVLIRFTNPSDKKLQLYAVENGVVPQLVKLLSSGTPLASRSAATSLSQLSQNTVSLGKSRRSRWSCVPPPALPHCEVHERRCAAKNTFCLVKAGAVAPLIEILGREEMESSHEAVTGALATLVEDEFWENGCNYLAKMSAIPAIIKVAEFGTTAASEKASLILEKTFRIDEYRRQYTQAAGAFYTDSD